MNVMFFVRVKLPEPRQNDSDSDTRSPRASPQKDNVLHSVTMAKFLIHKIRKLDPAFIK